MELKEQEQDYEYDYNQDYEFQIEQEEDITEVHFPVAINFQQEYINNQIDLKNFLNNHKISQKVRTLMVKWIIHVFETLYEEQNINILLSRAVYLMDVFLKNTQVSYTDQNIHLIGATCIFVASQIEEQNPLEKETLYEIICHRKFTINEINEFYINILDTLDHRTHLSTSYNYLQNLCHQMFGSFEDNQSLQVEERATYILTLCYGSYQMMQQNLILLATTVLGYTIYEFRSVHDYYQDIQGQNSSQSDVMKLIEITGINVVDFDNCYEILISLIADFQKKHSSSLF